MFSASPRRTSPSKWLISAAALLAFGTLPGSPAAAIAQGPPPPSADRPGPQLPRGPAMDPLASTQQGAATAVQRAYDAIGRVAAAAANSSAEGVPSLLAQSRNAYQQALSYYQANNFTGARETAMTSADLARAAEQLTTVRLIAEATQRAGVPAPPGMAAGGGPDPAANTYGDLARLTQHRADLAARIAQLPQSTDSDARGFLEQSSQLQQRAQALLNARKPEEAGAVARAADALLAACDHSLTRVLIASGRLAAEPQGPPLPADDNGPAADMQGPPPPPPDGPRQ